MTQHEANGAQLTWTSKRDWGSDGLTHRTQVTVDGVTWSFTVDQPLKGDWRARGWKGNQFWFYADGRTMKGLRDLVQAYVDELTTAKGNEA